MGPTTLLGRRRVRPYSPGPSGPGPIGSARRDALCDAPPDQLRPALVAAVGGMIPVGGDQLRVGRDLGPARPEEVDDLGVMAPGYPREHVVELYGQPADLDRGLLISEARSDGQI